MVIHSDDWWLIVINSDQWRFIVIQSDFIVINGA